MNGEIKMFIKFNFNYHNWEKINTLLFIRQSAQAVCVDC